ncbi:hypothetical protein [Parasphingorhabdus sp.]|uniref:hypothetical protein n=1 Tax=Parasphingorhabdus sp. TaxID=2709688 RepID=UPI002F91CE58
MPASFTYAEVEAILAQTYGISDTQLPGFRARLKNLQRIGFPEGLNTGRGKPAIYNGGHLFQLAFAIELLLLGLTPERVRIVVGHCAYEIEAAVLASRNHESPVMMTFLAGDLSGITTEGASNSKIQKYSFINSGSLLFASPQKHETRKAEKSIKLLNDISSYPRGLLVNVSLIVLRIEDAINGTGLSNKQNELWQEVASWAENVSWGGHIAGNLIDNS